jgi:hypothetical protein
MAVMKRRDGGATERIVVLALFLLGLVGCLLGIADPPAAGIQGGHGEQLLDLIRLGTAVTLILGLLLGPGAALRVLTNREDPIGLAFLPLPGFLLMFAAGGLAWLLGGSADPRAVACAVMLPVLLGSGAIVFALGEGPIFDHDERRTLLTVGCVLGIAIGRALWSLGPAGELYGGTVSKTLEVGDRSDSRISFIISQLVAHHEAPYGQLGSYLFAPYNFSSRGPAPGMAAAPFVLMTGGHPAAAYPEAPWTPFDREGFVAYRLAMMAFAATAFISLWDLLRRVAGRRVAQFGLLLAATTPFLVTETWFTWPKLLAASITLMALICVVERRFLLAGLLAGFASMMHPVALVSVPVIAIVVLWPLRGARWNRPRIGALAKMVVGLVAFPVVWRLLNGSHYDQNQFFEYLKQAGFDLHPSAGTWIHYRLHSLADTVVPGLPWFGDGHNISINEVGGISPGIIHFFFQYWTTVPFGFAIVFLPMLLLGLWRALRRWTWGVMALVVLPFVGFTIYWGASTSGMMREGLQFWALCVIGVLACEQGAERFRWLRSLPARLVLVFRAVEVLGVILIPTLSTRHEVLSSIYWPTDLVALALIFAMVGTLAWAIWSEAPPDTPPEAAPGTGLDSVVAT